MSDGANLGYTAEQSIKAILGGEEDQPEEPGMTPAQMAAGLENAPDDPDTCDDVARWAGKGVLAYLREHPEAVAITDAYDLFEAAFPRGEDGTLSSRYPQLTDISGFTVGWAVNAARYAFGAPAVQNPAILDL